VETLAGRVGRGYLARKAPRTVICARQERGQLARARGREGSAPIRWVPVRRTERAGGVFTTIILSQAERRRLAR
jgi:hypothetical protein